MGRVRKDEQSAERSRQAQGGLTMPLRWWPVVLVVLAQVVEELGQLSGAEHDIDAEFAELVKLSASSPPSRDALRADRARHQAHTSLARLVRRRAFSGQSPSGAVRQLRPHHLHTEGAASPPHPRRPMPRPAHGLLGNGSAPHAAVLPRQRRPDRLELLRGRQRHSTITRHGRLLACAASGLRQLPAGLLYGRY
jgi:hypothetical protein